MFHLKMLVRRLALVLFMMTAVRAVFWIANQRFFPKTSATDLLNCFAHGTRFDLSSLFWVNSLLIFLSLLPGIWQKKQGFQSFLRWLWLVPNLPLIALELADVAWFPFNQRRTILTDFRLLGETPGQIVQFLGEYWWLVALFFAAAFLLFRTNLSSGIELQKTETRAFRIPHSAFRIFLVVPIWLLAVRGGWQMRPISPITAAQFVPDPRLAPLVPNATMNILSSAQQKFIEQKNWFSDAELDERFSMRQNLGHAPGDFRPLNVVTIAFEGAGSEYLAAGWMPFLDSLAGLSITPKMGYANGMRSIQGNAAIVAGIPALMTDPWVFSPYQNNKIAGLAAILGQKGYETAFFHGSDPGSMQLDKMAAAAGFAQYFDRTAFPDQSFYDGQWGIFDRPFYQFFNEKIGQMRQPFYAHFFSMTSHHPNKVEPFFEEKYPKMDRTERSFRYADDALRQFFAVASRADWFKNTLFVIAADHTGPDRAGHFGSFEGKFRIPILFYQNGATEGFSKAGSTVSGVAQQIDMLPSVLDWLHFSGDFSAFGRSVFQQKAGEKRVAYVFENGIYQILDGRFLLTFDGEKPLQMFDYQTDITCSKNILGEKRAVVDSLEWQLKAIIQRHNRAMICNQLY